jgi:hypothetical protein
MNFGYGAYYIGVPLNWALLGAQINNLYEKFQFDDLHDQASIIIGYLKP